MTTSSLRDLPRPSLRSARRVVWLVALSLVAACGSDTIVQDLNEREANQILEVLADHGVNASKVRIEAGRNISYAVNVQSSNRLSAIKTLNQNELPRRRDKGYTDVFAESGLIPTSSEERAKRLAALEGEIERQLKLLEGILDAQVQIVIPEESALRTTQDAVPATTASATIKYMPDSRGASPLSDQQVRQLVASGVEKLKPENVFVVLAPSMAVTKASEVDGGSWMGRFNKREANMIAVAILSVLLLMGLGLLFTWGRLRAVRGRLLRLQNEIAKARRKPSEGSVPSIPSAP